MPRSAVRLVRESGNKIFDEFKRFSVYYIFINFICEPF